MPERDSVARQLREVAVSHMWRGEAAEALAVYDHALEVAESDDVRELLVIGKAEALLACEQEGREIQDLAKIVMRRRSPLHVYQAAAVLMRRYDEVDNAKAIFYGEIARDAAMELGDSVTLARLLNNLGIVMTTASRFAEAIQTFEQGLVALAGQEVEGPAGLLRPTLLANLGGAKVLNDDFASGISLLEGALPSLTADYARAEAFADLTLGYLQSEEYEKAEEYGRQALELASGRRQVRNANHLLGELMRRLERYDEAAQFFEVVASFYPEGSNIRGLLMSVDLTAVVNWKGC
ncbi:MAG TPA: hypothetical protein VFN10_05245 [Thermoanaerobaculia bacterium]|nr:hypothetical protein [Thermoanaerobaculia bacterium]